MSDYWKQGADFCGECKAEIRLCSPIQSQGNPEIPEYPKYESKSLIVWPNDFIFEDVNYEDKFFFFGSLIMFTLTMLKTG